MSRLFLPGLGGRMAAGARWCLRHLAVLVPVLVLVEGMLQLCAPSYRDQVFDHEFTGGHPLKLNKSGYRGTELSRDKPADEFRVLAVGDSTTFGTGVAVEEAWPAQLQRALGSGSTARSVTVTNLGVPACRLAEIESAIERMWLAFEPDLIVLAVSNNMPSFGWIRRAEEASDPYGRREDALSGIGRVRMLKIRAKRVMHRLCLPSFLSRNSQRGLYWVGLATHHVDPTAPYGPMLAHGWLEARLDPTVADQAWDLFRRDLASLAGVVEAGDAGLVVTHLPARFTLTHRLFDNEKLVPRDRLKEDPTEIVADLCADLGIVYADARAVLRRARAASRGSPLYIPFDFTHLDPQGHRAVAESLHEAITREAGRPR